MRRLGLIIAVAFFLAGCKGESDGIDHDAVKSAQEPLKAAAARAGGDWNRLSDTDKKLFMDRARGNEASAKMIFGMMARGPQIGPQTDRAPKR